MDTGRERESERSGSTRFGQRDIDLPTGTARTAGQPGARACARREHAGKAKRDTTPGVDVRNEQHDSCEHLCELARDHAEEHTRIR